MAVVLKAAADPDLRQALGLHALSQLALFGLEVATDPEIYGQLVGAGPEAAFERQSKV